MILARWIEFFSSGLSQVGIENPKAEVYLWLTQVTAKNRAYFMSHSDEAVDRLFTRQQQEQVDHIFRRRLQHEPLAYIVGSEEFYGRAFSVGSGVLIPRGDSELLIEVALGALGYPTLTNMIFPQYLEVEDNIYFMDLCTGTGCLAISFALEMMARAIEPNGIITDISTLALGYADKNRKDYGLEDNLHTRQCDLFPDEVFLSECWGSQKAQVILSNPPYISQLEMAELMPEVGAYEPHLALDGGQDGLDFYRRILQDSPNYLRSGGVLVLEHGYDQGETVPYLCGEYGYLDIKCFCDYGGQPRITLARLP